MRAQGWALNESRTVNVLCNEVHFRLGKNLVFSRVQTPKPVIWNQRPLFCITVFDSWMTTYLGKSCSFGLPQVPFVNCRQFTYLVISLLVLRAGSGIWVYQFLIIAYLFTLQNIYGLLSMVIQPDVKLAQLGFYLSFISAQFYWDSKLPPYLGLDFHPPTYC